MFKKVIPIVFCLICIVSLIAGTVYYFWTNQPYTTRETKEESPELSVSLRYPVAHQANINLVIDQTLKNELKKFKENFPFEKPNPDWKFNFDINYNAHSFKNYLTFEFTIFTFAGGAHPFTYTVTKTFDLRTGKEKKLADFFSDTNFKNRLFPIITKDLTGREISDNEWIKEGIKDLDKFAFNDKALIIFYDPYEVACYAAGPQQVEIPLSQIVDILKLK